MKRTIEEKYNDVVQMISANPNQPISKLIRQVKMGNSSFYKLSGIKSLKDFNVKDHSWPKKIIRKRKRNHKRYRTVPTSLVDELSDKLVAEVLRKIYQKLGV